MSTIAQIRKAEIEKHQWSKQRDILTELRKEHQTGIDHPFEEDFPCVFYYPDRSIIIVTLSNIYTAIKD